MMELTTDTQEMALKLANNSGITHSRLVSTADLKTHKAVRDACAQNSCGKFGTCWTCPPGVGDVNDLEERLHSFKVGLLVQNVTSIEDSWDFEGMFAASATHNTSVRTLWDKLREELPECEILPLGAGSCDQCEKCTYPDAPCRFPDQAMSSVEGYGIDVRALVESCGLQYINGQNTVSYVGLLLIR